MGTDNAVCTNSHLIQMQVVLDQPLHQDHLHLQPDHMKILQMDATPTKWQSESKVFLEISAHLNALEFSRTTALHHQAASTDKDNACCRLLLETDIALLRVILMELLSAMRKLR